MNKVIQISVVLSSILLIGCVAFTSSDGTDTNVSAFSDGGCNVDADCDDGDACTYDLCDPFPPPITEGSSSGECFHPLIFCNDGDPCTSDVCDIELGCNFPHICEDFDACTLDSCDEQTLECIYAPMVCYDGDSCTSDACDIEFGCTFEEMECPPGKECRGGQCRPIRHDFPGP